MPPAISVLCEDKGLRSFSSLTPDTPAWSNAQCREHPHIPKGVMSPTNPPPAHWRLLGQPCTEAEPRLPLDQNSTESRYLVSTLIHVAGRVVVDPQHRNKPIGIPVCLQRHRKAISTGQQLPEETGLHLLHIFYSILFYLVAAFSHLLFYFIW